MHPVTRSRTLATMALACFVLGFLLQFFTLRRGMPYGLTNRLFVATLFGWFIATSLALRRRGL